MEQKLKVETLITIPAEYTLLRTVDYENLLKDSEVGTWWTLQDVLERINRKEKWLKENVLENPRYKNLIDVESGGFVKYPSGGKSGYLFLATQTKQFLEKYFADIVGG